MKAKDESKLAFVDNCQITNEQLSMRQLFINNNNNKTQLGMAFEGVFLFKC